MRFFLRSKNSLNLQINLKSSEAKNLFLILLLKKYYRKKELPHLFLQFKDDMRFKDFFFKYQSHLKIINFWMFNNRKMVII